MLEEVRYSHFFKSQNNLNVCVRLARLVDVFVESSSGRHRLSMFKVMDSLFS